MFPSRASLPSISWASVDTEHLRSFAHWSHPILLKNEPVPAKGEDMIQVGPRLQPLSLAAFQNCCPMPVRIQEIIVETPALASERHR